MFWIFTKCNFNVKRACSIFKIPAITNNNMAEVVTCKDGATQALHKLQSRDDVS